MMGLLRNLKPKWWFAAHLHVRFEATVVHEPNTQMQNAPKVEAKNPDEILIDDLDDADENAPAIAAEAEASVEPPSVNPDEIKLDDEEEDVVAPPPPPSRPKETKFLALDKCLPKRKFLEVSAGA